MNTQLTNKIKKSLCQDQDFVEVGQDLYVKFDALKIHHEENEFTFSIILNEEVITEKMLCTSFNKGDTVTLIMRGLIKLDLN